jgi:thiamine kinase-like enzyme
LASVCQRFDDFVPWLLAAEPTIIHGEYYPENILLHRGVIHPVDWESAAVAAGEIDLAAVTEGWPLDVVHQCESAYRLARWPDGAPTNFQRTFDAARLYLGFRWLGGPECTSHEQALPRLEHLRRAAERLALI